MREVKVLVTLQVEEVDKNDTEVDAAAMQDAAVDVVENAVRAAEAAGFVHGMADKLSIGFVDAVLYEDDEEEA